MSNASARPPLLALGKIKTFGALGPKYEIVGAGHLSADGEWLVPIRVIESGEEVDYRFSRLDLDPDAS